jgi:hypothetical protein
VTLINETMIREAAGVPVGSQSEVNAVKVSVRRIVESGRRAAY